MYEIRGLRFEYGGASSAPDQRFRLALEEFHLAAGEKLAVVGPNGSGKTTLLRILALLEKPKACERFLFKGQEVGGRNRAGKPEGVPSRGAIGLLRQQPWIFRGTVAENLAYPLRMRGLRQAEVSARVHSMCERLHLAMQAPAGPRSLSGGEQKRVALGRVLIAEPEILLLDEPMAHLDRASQRIIAEILAETKTTAVFTTHDLHLALGLADRTLTLKDGGFSPEFLENVFRGRCENGTFVTRRGLKVWLPAGGPRDAASISIGPDAIRVVASIGSGGSPNAFSGKVTCIRSQGETVWIEVEAGETFTVVMSRASYDGIGLNLHREVTVDFPIDAVRLL